MQARINNFSATAAFTHLKKAFQLSPQSEQAALLYGQTLRILGHANEAGSVFEKVRSSWTACPELAYEYAQVLLDLDHAENALPVLETALHNGLPVPTHADSTPQDFTILATAPARLISVTDTVCEAPPALWNTIEPPGDLEFAAIRLFGDASPENVAKVAHNYAVMGVFTRGKGTVFNAGVCDWAYGLDRDPLVQRVTRNVLERLSG